MRAMQFIRKEFPINLLVADTVEDILPRLREAAPPSPELETAAAAPVTKHM
jgi:hypothetical protein